MTMCSQTPELSIVDSGFKGIGPKSHLTLFPESGLEHHHGACKLSSWPQRQLVSHPLANTTPLLRWLTRCDSSALTLSLNCWRAGCEPSATLTSISLMRPPKCAMYMTAPQKPAP